MFGTVLGGILVLECLLYRLNSCYLLLSALPHPNSRQNIIYVYTKRKSIINDDTTMITTPPLLPRPGGVNCVDSDLVG